MYDLVNRLATEPSDEPEFFLDLVWREVRTEFVLFPPGLLAAIDQQGAAVRDVLTPGIGQIAAGELAAYARGLVEVASEQDWETVPPQTQAWLALRLASVCLMAREFGYLPEFTAIY
jgi:hypothetical protein